MKNGFFPLSLLVFALIVISTPSFGAGTFDPDLKWRTIETEHFRVHYYQGMGKVAAIAAREAELARAKLLEDLGHAPRFRVHIVVCDINDSANGMTGIFPYPKITIFVTPPTSISSLDTYDTYLRTVITHEMTHVVILDMTRGLPRALRYLFGYSIAMNALMPNWLTEGAPVYEETALTTKGRGRSAYMDMLLRSAVVADSFPSIDRAGEGLLDWPGGTTPYIFGGAFYQWLVGIYGEEKMAEFFGQYSGQIVPFRVNSAAQKTFGKNFHELWDEWSAEMTKKYTTRAEEIEAAGIRHGESITESGFYNVWPKWRGESNEIIFAEYNADTGPAVKAIEPDGSNEKRLLRGNATSGLDVSPDGKKIVYSSSITYSGEPSKRFYAYNDLYTYDIDSEKSSRLTVGERAGSPAWNPDGTSVAYVSRGPEGTSLKTIDVESKEIETIAGPEWGTVHDTPAFAPDGRSVVYSAHVEGRGRDLYLLDLETKDVERLTFDPARDLDPVWTSNGGRIVFTSERTGVPNLFALDLDTRHIYQVTNVLGGAFQADVNPGGNRITYSGYSARGYDISVMDLDESKWTDAGTARRVEAVDTPVEPAPDVDMEQTSYNPIGTLMPRYMMPILWYDGVDFSLGLSTGGADPLIRHAWLAEASWGTASEFLNWAAFYTYSRFRPTVGAGIRQYAVSYGEIMYSLERVSGDNYQIVLSDDDYYEQRTEVRGWIEESFGFRNYPATVSFSYVWDDRDNWSDLPELTFDSVLPGRGVFSGVEAAISYDTRRAYVYSISPERGYSVRLGFEWLDEALGADYNQRIYTGDLRLFLPVPIMKHHVLGLRAAGGYMDGDKLYQGTFRVGGSVGESIISSPGRHFFMLRGYELAQFIGDWAVVGTAEYRFPLGYPQKGVKGLPVFVQTIHGAVFADYGGAFDRKNEYPMSVNGVPVVDADTGEQLTLVLDEDDDWNLGMGAEFRMTGYVGYGVLDRPVTGRAGYAKDVSGHGLGHTVFLELGTSF